MFHVKQFNVLPRQFYQKQVWRKAIFSIMKAFLSKKVSRETNAVNWNQCIISDYRLLKIKQNLQIVKVISVVKQNKLIY